MREEKLGSPTGFIVSTRDVTKLKGLLFNQKLLKFWNESQTFRSFLEDILQNLGIPRETLEKCPCYQGCPIH